MRVLFCASECAPFVKVGGLGDVSRSLPVALSKQGVDIRVAIPFYNLVDRSQNSVKKIFEFTVEYARRDNLVTVYEATIPGTNVPVLLFENEDYLSGGGEAAFTGLESEIRRFGFFDRAIAIFLRKYDYWQPDVLHLNDWHTGLVPHFCKKELDKSPAFLFTVHNLYYQGIADLDLFSESGLSIKSSQVLSWDAQDENVDFLLQGLATADVINTVSPTYAEEMMTEEFGEGLSGVLRARQARVSGVLNGIDTQSYDPETDTVIFENYGVKDWQEGKRKNKQKLQKEVGLPRDPSVPLVVFIGRLEPEQKGLELIEKAWAKLNKEECQFILLGVGDEKWEDKFRKLGEKNPRKFSAQIKFDPELARKMFAGGDILLMPSRFEPCGLPQMMAMRYGTVPVVHAVGGLVDTVVSGETGFTFDNYTSKALVSALKEAFAVYEIDQEVEKDNLRGEWAALVENGMKKDFSWQHSAEKYAQLYRTALEYRFGIANPSRVEYRKDELSGERAIVLGESSPKKETVAFSGNVSGICPFDEGEEERTPSEVLRIGRGAPDGPGWDVRVIPSEMENFPGQEIIIHSPQHERDFSLLSLDQIAKIIQAYVFRYRHYDEKGLPFVFCNCGKGSGASLPHSHSQLIVFEQLPESFQEELSAAKDYYQNNNNCPYCDLLKREVSAYPKEESREGSERFVWENEHFVVLVPYGAQWPYELKIIPKKHRENFADINRKEMRSLADVLKRLTSGLQEEFGDISYNFWIHSLSEKFAQEKEPIYYHWHLEFIPRMKELGGVELGAQAMVYDQGTPEEAAQELRKLFDNR
ncbi:MAG: glycogen/starch synthase [Patescibacteria group bacterium]